MKLRDLFDRIGPMFVGRASTEETAEAIYGADPGVDGKRLALYNRVRATRIEQLNHVFSRCAIAIGDAWEDIAFAYFARHPWGSFDYRPGGGELSSYLAEVAAERGLPAWLPELAALEWAINCGTWAAEEVDYTGPIRIATSVELHRFDHDLGRWLLHPDRPPQPSRRAVTVATWKAPTGAGRFASMDDVQLAILGLVRAGRFDPDQVPTSHGVTGLALAAFVGAGIVIGNTRELLATLTDPELRADTTSVGSDLAREFTLGAFVQARWEDGALQLWTPVAADVIASEDPALALVARQFAAPCSIGAAIAALSEAMPPAQVVEIADALESSGLLVIAGADPHPAVAAGWDVHEAAVHALTRVPDPTPPEQVPPAIRPLDHDHPLVALAPLGDQAIGDLAAVLARCVTTRRFAERAIPFETLSRVLGLAARNRDTEPGASHITRPYPSAGERHPLELYPVVSAGGVDGLAPGVYRYRPELHQLELLVSDPAIAIACLRDAGFAGPEAPGVLVKIAARFARAVRGPDGGSLQLVLQEVGCLIQTLYLAATALELGACAVTVSHDEAFAALALVEPWSEPVLGGVVLGMPAAI